MGKWSNCWQNNLDESSENYAKWKEPICNCYTAYDSIYIIFLRWQNHRNGEISGCQGLRRERGWEGGRYPYKKATWWILRVIGSVSRLINVNILVAILYYSFVKMFPLREPGYNILKDLSVLLLTCESTVILKLKRNTVFEIVHSISKLFQGYAWVKMFKGHWSRKLVDGGIEGAQPSRRSCSLMISLFIIKQEEWAISDICIQKHINWRDVRWNGYVKKKWAAFHLFDWWVNFILKSHESLNKLHSRERKKKMIIRELEFQWM